MGSPPEGLQPRRDDGSSQMSSHIQTVASCRSRIVMDLELIIVDVHDPVIGDTSHCVEASLATPVVDQGRLTDFHDQERGRRK